MRSAKTTLTFEILVLQKHTIAQNDWNFLRISNFMFVYLISCKKMDKSLKKWIKVEKNWAKLEKS